MAQLIRQHLGQLISVESRKTMQEEKWGWRKDYIGFCGAMSIYESLYTAPNKKFIVIYDIELHYLKTGAGELEEENGIITLTTKNSVYKFKIL